MDDPLVAEILDEMLATKDYARALGRLRPLANLHNPAAECLMGTMYHFGWGVSCDYQAAADWYKRSAAQDYPPACDNLGTLYATNYPGWAANEELSVFWRGKAAALGLNLDVPPK